MKHRVSLFMVTVVLLLSACGRESSYIGDMQERPDSAAVGTEPETKTGTGADEQELMLPDGEAEKNNQISENRPVKEVNYCYHNGLDYENKNFQDQVEYIVISGLNDERVEAKINDAILAAATELYERDLPPYRGIRVTVPDGGEEDQTVTVYTYVYFNESNILSVLLRKTIRSGDYSYYVEDVLPLNFDLRTGGVISLADLFADGYDYETTISEYIRTCISENLLDDLLNTGDEEYWNGFTLLRPFEKIEKTQKFIISSWNEIYLLVDYENREFDVGTQVQYLPVYSWLLPEKGKELAFTERYETWDDSLYREGRWKSLKVEREEETLMWISEDAGLTGVQFRTSLPKNIENPELARRFDDLTGRAEERAKELLKQKQFGQGESFGGDYAFQVSKYGNYLIERESYTFWSRDDYIYDTVETVYDSVTGKELTLADCFVPDLNYRELIVSLAMAEDSSISREDLVRGLKEPEFTIYPGYLAITYLRKDSSYGLYKTDVYLDYEDFDENVLTVFD